VLFTHQILLTVAGRIIPDPAENAFLFPKLIFSVYGELGKGRDCIPIGNFRPFL